MSPPLLERNCPEWRICLLFKPKHSTKPCGPAPNWRNRRVTTSQARPSGWAPILHAGKAQPPAKRSMQPLKSKRGLRPRLAALAAAAEGRQREHARVGGRPLHVERPAARRAQLAQRVGALVPGQRVPQQRAAVFPSRQQQRRVRRAPRHAVHALPSGTNLRFQGLPSRSMPRRTRPEHDRARTQCSGSTAALGEVREDDDQGAAYEG